MLARRLVSLAASASPNLALGRRSVLPAASTWRDGLGLLPSATSSSSSSLSGVFVQQSRGYYFPRKNWMPWRSRIAHERQAALRKKRHIWPRRTDPDEKPIFYPKEEGVLLSFQETQIRVGVKRMLDYAKLIRGRQLQDGIDWLESIARVNTEPILKLLRKAMEDCQEIHKMDLARLYIVDAQPLRGKYIRELRKHARGNYGIMKRPRNKFRFTIREMPLEEYFHRLYIFNKVPRSLAADMRLALHQSRVSPQMQKEWAPYLCAHSRHRHRMELKWMDSTRQFDYYEAREEWIQRYKSNLMRASTEAREARGLAALPTAE